ncbi:MAG TPA: FAD-binding oxidoreductase [Solirubrobacteraceae bacterium]|jgi:FAD/FMN-containing dehydrogenase
MITTAMTGRLVERGDAGWRAATQAFDLTVTQEPALVALPATDDDVVAIVDFARERGLQIAPQRTGHNAKPLGSLDDVVLVRTDALQGVELDLERRVARVRAGARWADVVPRASAFGLAALHGSTPDVSVAGYALGGGVGWYARKHGLAANSVAAIELVTADGRLRRVDHDHDPDLFWALRGGGGNFGLVTTIEIQLYPVAEVYAGMAFFPWERSSEVLHTWLEWAATVPDEVTSVGRILQIPPLPHLPAELRGRQFAAVDAVVLGDERLGRELLEPLRRLGPEVDTFTTRPPAGIAELHMDPQQPVPGVTDSVMLGDLPGEAIDRFVAAVGPGSGSRLLVADVRQLGGALRRPRAHHGALSTLDASFVSFGVGMGRDEATRAASHERLARLNDALTPYDTGRRYLNFADRPTDPARFFTPDAYRRLRAAKAAVDPDGLFRANHPIPPAR